MKAPSTFKVFRAVMLQLKKTFLPVNSAVPVPMVVAALLSADEQMIRKS